MNDERLSGALQENILTLLCYNTAAALQIRASVPSQMFESAMYRDVAGHAIDFIDQFGEAIQEHLPDSLEDTLKGEDKRKAATYKRLLDNLFLAKDSVNTEYVLSQLHKFLRQQTMKSAVVLAVEAIQKGDIDLAEVELQKGLNVQLTNFEVGTQLTDTSRSLAFLDEDDRPLLTGIDMLDERGIGPRRKETFTLMAPSGLGKTWGLIHFGKWALLQRQTVVHITLEMSERRTSQRYVQSFFSMSRKHATTKVPLLRKDREGALEEVLFEDVMRPSFEDPRIRAKLVNQIQRRKNTFARLIIKEFPTGALTHQMLVAYLDKLERHHKIVPDVLIVDYPDLMQLDPRKEHRHAVGEQVRQIRGLGVERNMATVIASQSNREGAKSRLVEGVHAGEDYSKIQTSDVVITLSQTRMEKRLGLARLYGDKVRNEEAKFVAVITQAYGIGQFCLDSTWMANGDNDYFGYVNRGGRAEDGEDDD